jgi:O-antigen biosynthesis protein
VTSTKFSILTPVYNPPEAAFQECAVSVLNQTYSDWEWCVVDDCSTADWVPEALRQLEDCDSRVRVVRRSENGGIAKASDDALAMATGEFVVLLDHDDLLDPNALAAVNHQLWLDSTTDYVYSDEDKVDTDGTFFGVFPKPAWSPERLLCQNYCCHISAMRRELALEVGGFRPGFDGAQDYDLVLRVTEKARKVVHIPEVLYHWRIVEGSTAGDLNAKPYAVDAGRRAVADALERRGIEGDVIDAGHGYHRVRRHVSSTPSVSIIVPTGGTVGRVWGLDIPFIVNMVDSVRAVSTYPKFEIIVVYDTPMSADLLADIERVGGDVKLVPYDEPFNFSRKCNDGALAASGDLLIFMNDDMEVRSPDWIESMIGFLEEPSVGLVGPMLLFDNFLVQSAGHTSAPPGHFARGLPPSVAGGPGWPLALNREVMGVTGACMAIRRETFFDIGGFSVDFPINYNDVDFCFKLIQAGFRIIWTPDAELFHFESKSRETIVNDSESALLYRLWRRYMSLDPYMSDRPIKRDEPNSSKKRTRGPAPSSSS